MTPAPAREIAHDARTSGISVHVLTEGFVTPNGRAFLFPLIVHRRALAEAGIEWRMFTAAGGALGDCDVLIVDSKFHKHRWRSDADGVLAEFAGFRRRAGRVLYFDTSDGSGWVRPDLLPLVDRYYKGQLLADRGRYLEPMYAHRPYADYYYREHGAADDSPEFSRPVAERGHLAKLGVSWNAGLADYSLLGPSRMALYHRLPWRALLRFERRFVAPSTARPRGLSCRMGTQYPRESVAWQRRQIGRRLGGRLATAKLPRRAYIDELSASKVVVSPFGFGEITLKDFEVFLTGGLLLKPDMSHMETWPDLYRPGKTVLTHRWDLSDLEERIDEALGDYGRFVEIARAGQELYRRHTSGEAAAALFAARLRGIVANAQGAG